MMKNPKQTRMCIVCRRRMPQKDLYRFQIKHNSICVFSGKGRSLYICLRCQDEPKALRIIMKRYKIIQQNDFKNLKEYGKYGKSKTN